MRSLFLPLKLTEGVEITKTFETHISKKPGSDSILPIRSTFEEMQKLRNALDYNKMQAQINNDYRLAPEFQLQIINYLRYVYLIDTFFKSDFPDSKSLRLNFPWTDSFQPKKVKVINHSKYELASCLYNLAICYYSEGIYYIASPGVQEKRKGITKLRNALWCIHEIRQALPVLLTNPNDLPSDLNLSYINLLHNYFIGLTYAAVTEVLSADKKNGLEKLASLSNAAAKNFQMAFNIINTIKPCPIPDPTAKALKINLLYNAVMSRSDACFQRAQIHLTQVDENIRAGHMGFAVSYLRITKMDFDAMLKSKSDLDLLTQEQKTALLEKNKIIQANYDNCSLKNQRVYQQPEYSVDHLPEIPEEKAQITPIEPEDIKKKLNEERLFEIFLPSEILAIKREFMNYVAVKMLEIENGLKNANNVKNKLYADGYVNYLLDLQSQNGEKKFEIPPHLKQRIDKFKKNGGVNAYMFTKKNILEANALCGKTMQDIKGSLAAEKEQDEISRRKFAGQWIRPYSEQVNQEYVLKLKDLEQKLFIAENTDKDVMKKFDQYQDWMQKFSLPDDQILSVIPRSSDSAFMYQSKSKLEELAEINRRVTDLIDLEKQRTSLRAFTDEFMKKDFMSSFAAIHAGTVDMYQEFDKLLVPYKEKLSQIENQMNEAYPLIDAISHQAKGIVTARGDANNNAVKILEEMNLAITIINDIFNDFKQAATFYGNLNFHLNTLQKVVQDFCLAREIEKSTLLQEFAGQENCSNMNQVNAQPFFHEGDLKFRLGESVYQPLQQNIDKTQAYNPLQQQNQNQNQGYTNTQVYMPPNQNVIQSQAYFPPGQGQTHTQIYNPNQYQQYNSNQGQQQYNNNTNSGFSDVNATSHMGYMPMPKPDQQAGMQGQFGNVVESAFIPSYQGDPLNNPQGKY